jgi:transcriptional regulator of acetoin/glycerol metabolism
LGSQDREWTLEEVEAAGLPLYWSRAWVEEVLPRLRSFRAIAREYGYNEAALGRYVSRRFGLKSLAKKGGRARLHTEERGRAIALYESGLTNAAEIARRLGYDRTDVWRWLRQHTDEAA